MYKQRHAFLKLSPVKHVATITLISEGWRSNSTPKSEWPYITGSGFLRRFQQRHDSRSQRKHLKDKHERNCSLELQNYLRKFCEWSRTFQQVINTSKRIVLHKFKSPLCSAEILLVTKRWPIKIVDNCCKQEDILESNIRMEEDYI